MIISTALKMLRKTNQNPPMEAATVIPLQNHIPGGFYLKARKTNHSAIAHAAPHVREIWDWLIGEANHKDCITHGKTIRRGQVLTDYKEIREALHWHVGFIKMTYKKHHVDTAMVWLRERSMILTQRTTRGLIVTICNYDSYQNPKNYETPTIPPAVPTSYGQGNRPDKQECKELEERIERASVSDFYIKEMEAYKDEAMIVKYKNLVEYLQGKNDEDLVFVNVLNIPQQLTFRQYLKLRAKAEAGVDLREILMSMENTPKAIKDKKSLYLTLNNWASIRQKSK
jgi:hypothetical protein